MKKILKPIILLFLANIFCNYLDAQTINSIVKTGVDKHKKDWYESTKPSFFFGGSFYGANDIAVDSMGNIYYTDSFYITKIQIATGVKTIIAGKPTRGFSGDSGLAIKAQLNIPTGITIDHNNNIIFVDGQNFRIRKINQTTGIIETIAGKGIESYSGDDSYAKNAYIGSCYGITVDKYNNILFTDLTYHVVRRIDNSSGIISRIAGVGYGGTEHTEYTYAIYTTLSSPIDVAVDNYGDIYIAEMGNNKIKKIIASSNRIYTFAGSNTAPFANNVLATSSSLNYPNSICFDDSNNLFIVEFAHTIRKVNYFDNKINLIAGKYQVAGFMGDGESSSVARFKNPIGIVYSPISKTIILNDQSNNRIREISNTGKAPIADQYVDVCHLNVEKPLTAMGTDLKWYYNPWGGIGTTTPIIPKTDLLDTITYFVSQTISGKESIRAAIVVRINAPDSLTVWKDSDEYCPNATTDFLYRYVTSTDIYQSGISLNIFTDNKKLDTVAQTYPAQRLKKDIKKYYLQSVNQFGCASSLDSINVFIRENPPIPKFEYPINICRGSIRKVIDVQGTNMKWYNSLAGGYYTSTAPSPQSLVVGTTYYYVSQSDDIGCTSEIAEVKVNINPIPSYPQIISPIEYCQMDKAEPLEAYGNIHWLKDDSSFYSKTAPIPSTKESGYFSYLLKAVNEYNCSSFVRNIEVTVKPKPEITSTISEQGHTGQSITMVANTDSASILKWSNGSNLSKITITPNHEGLYNYWVYATAPNGCISDTLWHRLQISASHYWDADFKVFPNPFKNKINISNVNLEDIMYLNLYTLEGKKVHQSEFPLKSLELNIPDQLPSGFYILEINTVGRANPSKLIFKE
ncbi:MAG: T9SS type A sorting domain-containing protein [Chitinophagaceae bacterium]|nr:T9SS type A sorting domain-containing protein [Chitinophagaceae bacterium]